MMEQACFKNVKFQSLTGGTASLHCGTKTR